jgi:hypothetical protein
MVRKLGQMWLSSEKGCKSIDRGIPQNRQENSRIESSNKPQCNSSKLLLLTIHGTLYISFDVAYKLYLKERR